jgi:hypothetical protein
MNAENSYPSSSACVGPKIWHPTVVLNYFGITESTKKIEMLDEIETSETSSRE